MHRSSLKFRKSPKLLTTIVLSLYALSASAHYLTSDGCFFNIISEDDLTVEVTYRGNSYDAKSNEYKGDVIIPATIKYSGRIYSVTSIADYAIADCSELTSITIPSTVTYIGKYAFKGCTGLSSINIPESITYIGDAAFEGCSAIESITFLAENCSNSGSSKYPAFPSTLKKLTIGPDVQSIPEEAFKGCAGLTSLTIPKNVTSIGRYAFYDCSNMTSLSYNADNCTFNKDISTFPYSLKTITFGSNVKAIPDYAFRGCQLDSITIPKSITSIGTSAFEGCGLKSVIIGESVTSIGDAAFCRCHGLSSVIISPSVTSIGQNAFFECLNLTSIDIPNSVITIGQSAFKACESLHSIIIPESVTYIGSDAFANCYRMVKSAYPYPLSNPFEYGAAIRYLPFNYLIEDGIIWSADKSGLYFVPYNYQGEFIIPDFVSSIHTNAFHSCEELTTVTIPESVTSIYENAFYDCSELTSVTIPSSISYIGENAFYGCTSMAALTYNAEKCSTCGESSSPAFPASLKTLTIGPNVTYIPPYAFKDCHKLTSVTIPNSVTTICMGAFYGCSSLKSFSAGYSLKKKLAAMHSSDVPALPIFTLIPRIHQYATFAPSMTSTKRIVSFTFRPKALMTTKRPKCGKTSLISLKWRAYT